MYESPTQLIRDIVPNPLVSFTVIARAAGVLYLAGIILPFLSDRIGFSAYTSWRNTDPIPLAAPFDFELIIISTFGVVAGPAETAEAEGLLMGLLDFIFTPFFTLTFPLLGAILTVALPVLGVLFLFGHHKYASHLTWGFLILLSFYFVLFGMNAATLHVQFGLQAVTLATGLMLFAAIDKTHGIGLVSNNGYPLPGTRSLDEPQPEAVISDRGVRKAVRKVGGRLPLVSSLVTGEQTQSVDHSVDDTTGGDGVDEVDHSESNRDTSAKEQRGASTYAGSATRNDVEQS